jgi:uncharacterized lipoprotein YddW (UPF0748 family)
VYWDFEHSTAPYADVVDWWASIARGTGVDVLIGHAPSSAYQYNWPTESLSEQLRYNQKHPEIKGSVMYSAAFLDYSQMQYVEANNWTVTPLNAWELNLSDITASIDGTLSGNLYVDDVVVTLTASETIWYKLDDGLWTEYTIPFDVIGTGAHVVYMKTIDSLGEESAISSINIPIQYLNIDVPEISISGTMIDDNYVVGSNVIITSEGETIYVAINHGSVGVWEEYTGPITLDDDGGYYIRAKTIDALGTESDETTLSVTLVEECYDAPQLTLVGTGTDPYYQSATVTLTGDTTVLVKINDGTYSMYTAPLEFNNDGEFTIFYKNDDACSIEFSRTFNIDTIAPVDATTTITGDYDGTRYYTSVTDVSIETTESNVSILYRVHDGSTWTNWRSYTTPLHFIYTANYTIEYYTQDRAGNNSETTSLRVRLLLPKTETNPFVIRDGSVVTYYNSTNQIQLPTEYTEKTAEIRAIWVATVGNIDIGRQDSIEAYKLEILNMLDTIEENNFNVMFFQVRPMNDAWYDSSYAPWSRYITGTEGQDPGWDIIKFVIEEAHKRGIEFHAWLNPYRVSTGSESKATQLSYLHEDNWAKQHPDMVISDDDGKLILNPGEPQVQAYIKNVIQELIALYDIDGIHFDDYFYSYNGTPDGADETLYNNLKEEGQTIDDWRRENINTVVREVHELITAYNTTNDTTIEFGISPFGIWKSGGEDGSNTSPYTMQSYSDQYADSKRWVEEGWVDYILPQLYWEFDHGSAPFADLTDWWAALCETNNVDLIIGHGFYRYDDDSWDNEDELLEQLRYIAQFDSVIGSSFFTYNTLNSLDADVVQAIDRLNNYYWTEYPSFPWTSTVEKEEPLVCEQGYHEEDGVCVEDPLVCDDGYHEENGQCVIDPLVCNDGYHEEEGQCVKDPLVCENGYYEYEGECVEIPTCPDGYERIDGGCKEIVEPDTGCFSTLHLRGTIAFFIALGSASLYFIRKRPF